MLGQSDNVLIMIRSYEMDTWSVLRKQKDK